MTPSDANLYISTGFHIRALFFPAQTKCRYVIDQIANLIKYLDSLEYTYPKKQLEDTLKEMENLRDSKGKDALPNEEQTIRIQTVLRCVDATVRQEALGQRLITLQTGDVSTKLRSYAKAGNLSTTQTYLFDEAVRCIETGAYRSAIVMAWNLIYDRIREWVFKDANKLAAFNVELAKIVKKNGNAVFDQITEYEDFFDGPTEAVCIDLFEAACILDGKPHDDLRTYLRRRNSYAHASDKQPTATQANALIEDLLDTLVSLGI